MEILHRDNLDEGGFAGLREHRLVMDPRVFGDRTNRGTWAGLGDFVYLADARFQPKGETEMHSHREIDVISVMVDGRISHAGSLEHGQEMGADEVQVQRAGGEGFSHNEINPDDGENRMIQLWVLPETAGEPASYKFYRPTRGRLNSVYGGPPDQPDTFASRTRIDVALLETGQTADVAGPYLAYLTKGGGVLNGTPVREGDLVRGADLAFEASEDAQLIVVHTA